jgi:tetrahydromethanopterin S-methyltransferase subunit G
MEFPRFFMESTLFPRDFRTSEHANVIGGVKNPQAQLNHVIWARVGRDTGILFSFSAILTLT